VLMMPASVMLPAPHPLSGASVRQTLDAAFGAHHLNTAPFNLTHHPAISVPAGSVDGLPVGAMFVGRHFDEAACYRAARLLEQSVL